MKDIVQSLHYTDNLPTLVRLSASTASTVSTVSTVSMYAADHLPPHFHVRLNDDREALVEIATLQPLTSRVAKRELAEALDWASANQHLLLTKWKELNP